MSADEQEEVVQQYGISKAISTEGPTEADLKLSRELETTLQQFGIFESEDEAELRQEVLGKLRHIVREWIMDVGRKKNMTERELRTVGGHIYTFGSYRLGVHGKGADIDTCIVTPRHVDREEFFGLLYDTLSKREEVTEIIGHPDAYVPVIKLKFAGIHIDLIVARLALPTIPDDLDLLDVGILSGVDEVSVRCLNGCRVTDQMLRLVPDKDNFRMALRCIKLWAKRRGIYPNAMGYLGGIGWAMLLARVCQLYPNATAAILVLRFFEVFHLWSWPTPVLLNQLEEANLGHRVWNPKLNPRDGSHHMPIITPAYPAINASHNVTPSTLKVMKDEFDRGVGTMLKIQTGKATWSDLFFPSDFFFRHRNYIQVDAYADNNADHRRWENLLEARLRVLVATVERSNPMIAAYPYPYGYTQISQAFSDDGQPIMNEDGTQKSSYRTTFFVGIMFPGKNGIEVGKSVDLTPAVQDFTRKILEKVSPQMMLNVRHVS
eukprot:Ihof_evm1s140 gene=Ihof_evmTU1s140